MAISDVGVSLIMDDDGRVSSGASVGTPGFAAPEVFSSMRTLRGKSYSGVAADVFSIGATVFSQMTGTTPKLRRQWRRSLCNLWQRATGSSAQQQQQYLPGYKLQFPAHRKLSPALCDLLSSMMERRPERRPSIEEIVNHPFFDGFDWPAFDAGRMEPPQWAQKAAKEFAGVPRPTAV
jgi:serine/threonine protein kinase